jgi:YceI-like domain
MFKGVAAILFAASVVACTADAPLTDASWQLNGTASDLTVISVKNGNVVETSRFESLSGSVSASGEARLNIDAASFESYVEIRNERLRDIFFEVTEFPNIQIAANLDPDLFAELAIGDNLDTELQLAVSLHGDVRTVYAPVRVIRNGVDSVLVVSSEAALIDARDFGLGDAVEALAGIAGLNGITPVFPVNVYLVFERG